MTLYLTRNDFTAVGIFGTIEDDKGKLFLATLEHSFDGKPALSDGTYTCVKGIHRLHNNIPFVAYEIMNVPGHTGVLVHVGNTNADSSGCVLVGIDREHDSIRHSLIAFSKFMGFLNDALNFTLVVKSSTN